MEADTGDFEPERPPVGDFCWPVDGEVVLTAWGRIPAVDLCSLCVDDIASAVVSVTSGGHNARSLWVQEWLGGMVFYLGTLNVYTVYFQKILPHTSNRTICPHIQTLVT